MNYKKLLTTEYWAAFWHSNAKNSILRQTQQKHPERWRHFYDEIAEIWESMTGGAPAADVVASLLFKHGSMLPKESDVLDVGCGAGSLSLAIARKGARVTAIDDSAGMIEFLKRRISDGTGRARSPQNEISPACGGAGNAAGRAAPGAQNGITPVCGGAGGGVDSGRLPEAGAPRHADGAGTQPGVPSPGYIKPTLGSWTTIDEAGQFDLVIAAFFPPAWEPDGILHFERLSRSNCALVVPTGGDGIPIRREIWSELMKTRTPGRQFLVPYIFNYLHARRRTPDVAHFSWQAHIDVDFETAVYFYCRYFALFSRTGTEVEKVIRDILKTYSHEDRIQSSGEYKAVLICWSVA